MSRHTSSGPAIEALLSEEELRAPTPGYFRLAIDPDHLVTPGDIIGELEVLGRVIPIIAPRIRGLAKLPAGTALGRRAVGYNDVLLRVTAAGALGALEHTAQAAAVSHGLVFRAPTSGRFYGRPTPDKPAFVTTGSDVATGTTICLLEVMKTFHRVTYGGPDVPPRAKVRDVLVADGADVNQGDPLLALDP